MKRMGLIFMFTNIKKINMKRILSLFIMFILVVSLSSVLSAAQVYNTNEYLSPLWEGNIVYDESVCVLQNRDKTFSPISLTYKIDEIISVKSSDLLKTYQPGIDYVLENGKLKILKQTSIPYFTYDEYYPFNGTIPKTGGGFIAFSEGSFFHERQVVITYKHSDTWQGTAPAAQAAKLPNTMYNLENKQPMTVLFYGDSITVGANSSSFVSAEPNLPIWPKLVTNALKEKYGYNNIFYANTAVGGTTSSWGVENVDTRAVAEAPDLVFLGFGMNDGNTDPKVYKNNIKTIINEIRSVFENCEFVLVATTLPNKEAAGFYANQINYINELNEIASELSGIAVADMTTLHNELLQIKSFRDMTGNNVNHPNDFLTRLYAQVMLQTLSYSEILGDADLDGKTTSSDARFIMDHVIKEQALSPASFKNADMDKNGKVTTTDVRKVLRLIVEKEA